MKKQLFITISSLLLIFSAGLFAQEADAPIELPALEASGSGKKADLHMQVGGYFNWTPTAGSIREYITSNLGGGAKIDLGFGIKDKFQIGPAIRVAYNTTTLNPDNADLLSGVTDLQVYGGCFFNISIGSTGLAIQPEVCYGATIYFPKTNPEYDNDLQSKYIDQTIQAAVEVQYSNPKLLKGRLVFELAPTYSISLEKSTQIHAIGGRAGVSFKAF